MTPRLARALATVMDRGYAIDEPLVASLTVSPSDVTPLYRYWG